MAKLGVLVGTAALVAGAAIVAEGASTDSFGNLNIDALGYLQYGDCAETLNSDLVENAVTDTQMLESIKAIGRACGYCATNTRLIAVTEKHRICVDPETITLTGSANSKTVQGYMTAVPELDEGYLYNSLDKNPAVGTAAITSMSGVMVEYLDEAFDESTAGSLVPKVNLAPGSSHPWETAQNAVPLVVW